MSGVDWSTKNKIKKLIKEWMSFHDFISLHLGKEGVMMSQEKEFLNTKAKIADLLPVIGTVESGGAFSAEGGQVSRGMMDLMSRCPSLSRSAPLSEAERSEMLREWHGYYLFLNKLSGAAEMGMAKRHGLSPIGAPGGTPMSGTPVGRVAGGALGGSWLLQFVIKAAIVVILALFVMNYFGVSGADLKNAANKGVENVQSGVTEVKNGVTPSKGIEKYFPETNLDGSAKTKTKAPARSKETTETSRSGEKSVLAPASAPLSAVNNFVNRISGKYPTEVTIALLGGLLLGIGYLVFVRGR